MFTPDDAAALPGPGWLRDRRAAAAESLGDVVLPTTEEEIWRYSRIEELDLDEFPRLQPVETSTAAAPLSGTAVDAVTDRAATVVLRDGVITRIDLDPALEAAGVTVGPLADLADGAELVGAALGDAPDVFATMNDAFSAAPVVVRVPKGVTVDRPVVVSHCIETDGMAVFPRLVVQAGADSDLTIVEHFASADVRALISPIVELEAGPAARLRYLAVQELGQRVWQIGTQVLRADQEATTLAGMVALGGDYARMRADSKLIGRGARGDLLAVYFGEANQMHDFRTFQDHVAPDTTSELLFKGAVEGRARSVYTGLIKVRPDARGTNAFQTNRNIKLSEHAWAESVPNLEIENNDVRCSHASAVGPIDENQRFYLESRGVPPWSAERLVVLGFFGEVLERLPVPELAGPLRARVAEKFDRRDDDQEQDEDEEQDA